MSTTTAAEKLLLQMVDDYTQKEIAPQDMPMDAAGDFPAGFMEKLTATGFLGRKNLAALALVLKLRQRC